MLFESIYRGGGDLACFESSIDYIVSFKVLGKEKKVR